MTIQGAIAELQNLLEVDDVPFYYKGGIEKVIETLQMEMTDRKTENISEEPNNCKAQTYKINPKEPTNDDKCFECDDFFTCGGQCNKIEDEPQTDCAWR